MKRITMIARLLSVLLALALVAAACGNDSESDETDASSASDDAQEQTDDGDDGAGDDSEEPTDDGDDTVETDDGAAGDDDADDDGQGAEGPVSDPEATNGFDGETISLGYLTDQSGTLSIVGNPLAQGSQVYWDHVNAEGGVAGKYQVELVIGDTKDDSSTAVQEYQKLKDDVVMFAEILSTPPTQAVLEFLKQDDMIGVPGSLAGLWLTELNLLPNGSAYEYEMINIADWFVNESGLGSTDSVACSVAVDDLYGQSTVRGVEHAADEFGFDIAASETISRGQTDFSAVVSSLEGAGCEVVYAVTVPTEQHAMLAEALAQGFEPVWLGALPSYLNLFAGGAPERYKNFYAALDTPDFSATDIKGMADFLDRFATYGEGDANTFHLSGYFQQIAVHALLEKAVEMGDLSREGLLAARAELGEVELDGLAGNFVYGVPGDTQVPASPSRIFVFDADAPPNLLTQVAEIDSPAIESFEL